MTTIDVRGTAIGYTDTGTPPGRPDAPAVVFGHGILFGGWMFRHQIAALRDRYRCVTIDWRGQGETPATRAGYDMDSLTADAVGLIDALGVGPAHWVGLSIGGFVGQRIAARHGDRLRSLTLLGTSADADPPATAREETMLAWFQVLSGIKPLLGKVKPLMFGPAFLADPGDRAQAGPDAGCHPAMARRRPAGRVRPPTRRPRPGSDCRTVPARGVRRRTMPRR